MSLMVCHLVQQLSLGGAGRALVAAAHASHRERGFRHRVVSLVPPDRGTAQLAADGGLVVQGAARLEAEVAAADVTVVHFWNTPELYAALHAGLPPTRLVAWIHVAGDTAPHVLTPELVAHVDRVVVTSAHTLELPVLAGRDACLVAGGADLSRVDGARPRPHEGFRVGYLGAVDFSKLHPEFVAMSAAIDVAGLRVVVAGDGGARATLEAQAGASARFEFLGYVHDVRAFLETLDVLGHPLADWASATGELAVQEAMAAGVVPVVMARGTSVRLVDHGRTGLVARTPAEYRAEIERLHRDPELRARLGAAAREHARQAFGAARAARGLDAVLQEAAELRRRERRLPAAASGARRFAASLGDHGAPFLASLEGGDVSAAEEAIAAAHPALAGAGAGGILHYRLYHPDDPDLRRWAGLVLERQGRPALAAAEFVAARRLGRVEVG